jgi:hypothetical protein
VINRRHMSGWKVRRLFGTRSMATLTEIDPGTVRNPLRPKHRYAYLAMGKRQKGLVLAELTSLIQPYPKRDKEGIGSMDSLGLVGSRDLWLPLRRTADAE